MATIANQNNFSHFSYVVTDVPFLCFGFLAMHAFVLGF